MHSMAVKQNIRQSLKKFRIENFTLFLQKLSPFFVVRRLTKDDNSVFFTDKSLNIPVPLDKHYENSAIYTDKSLNVHVPVDKHYENQKLSAL